MRSRVSFTSSSVSPGVPTISVIAGNQLFSFATRRPSRSTLGQSSIENGTPLLGITFFATRTDPVSSPISGQRAFFCGWVLRNGDRKSTRLNSSHLVISYAVFCLKKKKKKDTSFCVLPFDNLC